MISIAVLKAAGLSADQIVRVLETAENEKILRRREQNRINKQNQRARQQISDDCADRADTSPPLSSPSMVSPITPSLTPPPISPSLDLSIKSDWPKDFRERFWDAYPRKVGKKAVFRKLEAISRAGEIGFSSLLAAIATINTSDPQFIPHPATWLNQGRYLDQLNLAPKEFKPPAGAPTHEELMRKYSNGRH